MTEDDRLKSELNSMVRLQRDAHERKLHDLARAYAHACVNASGRVMRRELLRFLDPNDDAK